MKIVFFGNPAFASNCLKYLNSLDYIKISLVVTNPDKKMGRGQQYKMSDVKKTALNLSNKILEVDTFKDNAAFDTLKKIKADLFIVVAYKYLPEKIYKLAKYGAINLHASLLPKYRGASPIQYALINGDNITGLTTFFINNKIDCGDIIYQKSIKITNKITFVELYEKLSSLCPYILDKTLNKIIKEDRSSFIKQPLNKKSDCNNHAAPKIFSEDFKININKSSYDIHNRIRALNYKGSYGSFLKLRIKFFDTFYDINNDILTVGSFKLDENNNLLIGTGKGVLIVKKLQLESRGIMDAKTFYNTYKLKGKFE